MIQQTDINISFVKKKANKLKINFANVDIWYVWWWHQFLPYCIMEQTNAMAWRLINARVQYKNWVYRQQLSIWLAMQIKRIGLSSRTLLLSIHRFSIKCLVQWMGPPPPPQIESAATIFAVYLFRVKFNYTN